MSQDTAAPATSDRPLGEATTGPLRVLMVEDSPTDAKLIMDSLRRARLTIEAERVEQAEAMRTALATREWDLVLCDWYLPTFSATAALAILRERDLDLPFIIVSGSVGEELAVEAMRAGAHDYVLKDRLARLAPAVERELRESRARRTRRKLEARFRAMIEKSAEAVTLHSDAGAILYASPAAGHILGASAEALVGTSFVSHVHPDDRAAVARAMADVRREAPREGEPVATSGDAFRLLRADGTATWVEATRTNRLGDPDIGAVVCNFRDVSERKSAIDRLRVSEARFGRLAESGVIGIAVGAVGGPMREANAALCAMTGFSVEEFEAGHVSFRAQTPEELRPWLDVAREQLAARGMAKPWESELLRKDGTRIPVLVGLAALDPPDCIGVFADLTEQKRAEEGMRAAEAALRETEAQLRHAQKMEAIGRLAGGVAHDFNNILSVILGYTDMVLSDLQPAEPLRADLEEVRKAGERGAALTQQLLLFSRHKVMEPEVTDLGEVVLGTEKMLKRLVGEDVDVTVVRSRSPGRVKVAPGHIEQIVMNLAVNARDAMPAGGRLTIETTEVLLDEAYVARQATAIAGAYMMLAVTDTGIGMDRETQARIFEPFFTTKETGKGTGLGLSTVFGIVQQAGGNIWVYSEPGQGTTFKVYLPRVDAGHAGVQAAAPLTLHGSETVLVVEDEDAVRGVVVSALRRYGYRVVEAGSPAEALAYCERDGHAIDLLLSDVVMPGMSGPALAKRFRELRPDVKVLCMSGYTDESVYRHGLVEAGLAFIQKPVTPASLMTQVRRVLDGPMDIDR